jgi:hypothetical protein
VGEDADGVTWRQLGTDGLQQPVGPVDDHVVGQREAPLGGEHRPGVAHRDAVPEHLGHPHQGRGEVDRPEDQHPRGRHERLDEDGHVVLAGLAVGPVATHARGAGRQLADGVAAHHPGEVGVGERAGHGAVGPDEELAAGARPGDHRGQGHRPLGPDGCGQLGEQVGHQSRGSTYRWIVPPHVSPTAKASSSL